MPSIPSGLEKLVVAFFEGGNATDKDYTHIAASLKAIAEFHKENSVSVSPQFIE